MFTELGVVLADRPPRGERPVRQNRPPSVTNVRDYTNVGKPVGKRSENGRNSTKSHSIAAISGIRAHSSSAVLFITRARAAGCMPDQRPSANASAIIVILEFKIHQFQYKLHHVLVYKSHLRRHGDGVLDVFLGGTGDVGEDRAVEGVLDRDEGAGLGRDLLAVDPQAVVALERRRRGGGSGELAQRRRGGGSGGAARAEPGGRAGGRAEHGGEGTRPLSRSVFRRWCAPGRSVLPVLWLALRGFVLAAPPRRACISTSIRSPDRSLQPGEKYNPCSCFSPCFSQSFSPPSSPRRLGAHHGRGKLVGWRPLRNGASRLNSPFVTPHVGHQGVSHKPKKKLQAF